jgi:hypothetical protein
VEADVIEVAVVLVGVAVVVDACLVALADVRFERRAAGCRASAPWRGSRSQIVAVRRG